MQLTNGPGTSAGPFAADRLTTVCYEMTMAFHSWARQDDDHR